MKKFLSMLAFLLFTCTAQANQPTETPTPAKAKGKIELKILYAGLPETDRAKDFMDFLGKNFKTVTFTDFNKFDENKTEGFDVVIMDHDGEDFRAKTPNISRSYSRATITMGVPGAFICSSLQLKTGYL